MISRSIVCAAGCAVVLALTDGPRAEWRAPAGLLAITGATVIDGTGAAPSVRTVIVRDGVVEAVLPGAGPVPDGARIVEGRGRFLIPGLWDMHAHLAIRPEPQPAERIMLPLLLAHGIVGVRDMGGPPDRLHQLRLLSAAAGTPSPRILTPGPFLDGPGEDSAMFRRILSSADAAAAARDLGAAGFDFFKAQAGLSADMHAALMREARARGAVVAGHAPLAMTIDAVVASGQRSIEHVSPALVGDGALLFACSPREAELRAELLAIERDRESAAPGQIAARERALRRQLVQTFDAARTRALGARLKQAGVWIVPTLIWSSSLRPLSATDDGKGLPMEYVPAATRARWMQNRARYLERAGADDFAAAQDVARVSAAAVLAMHEGGAAVLAGTDAFDAFVLPGVSLHQELALLVRAGLTPLAALQSATLRAAEYRGVAATEGTIARGKRADFVLLDADPLRDIANVARIHAVELGGRVQARGDLDALLAGARAAAQ